MLKKLIKSVYYRCEKILKFFNKSEKVSISFNELEIIEELEKDILFINCYINDKSIN
jgi:hypothetical protein